MGRETVTYADLGDEAGEVKLLLESSGLILRGAIRRTYPRDTLGNIRIDGDTLHLTANGEPLALHLGAKDAAAWAKAIATPPPSLASKLDLTKGATALCLGPLQDEALRAALSGNTTDDLASASLLLAIVTTAEDLQSALNIQSRRPHLPIWLIYPKGTKSPFGDTQIRTHMRNLGFIDTKTSAVSESLTATKYVVKSGK